MLLLSLFLIELETSKRELEGFLCLITALVGTEIEEKLRLEAF
jgi:hypothetical protein